MSANEAISATLSSVGHTLEGSKVEFFLQPLRLAFETKNPKLIEPSLDFLHVSSVHYYMLHFPMIKSEGYLDYLMSAIYVYGMISYSVGWVN